MGQNTNLVEAMGASEMPDSSSPVKCGPSLEHYRTEYLQGASEAWLKIGKSDLKTDKNIPQLYLVVTGQPSLEGLQGWR